MSALGVIVGNRDFFPDQLVSEGRLELLGVLGAQGIETIVLDETTTNLGAVETWQDSQRCADLFRAHRDRIDGILVSLGGAIGPIYATALMKLAATVRGFGPEPGEFTLDHVATCVEAGAAAVAELGHAKPADKTILDALLLAAEALRASEAAGASLPDALTSAAEAAKAGAESTADMIATIGRASRLGERSRGWPDPGATSFAIIAEALVRAFRKQTAAGGSTG